jgi:polysaccharide export outer membrane protein
MIRGIATRTPSSLHCPVVLQRFLLAPGMCLVLFGCATPPPPSSAAKPPVPLSVSSAPYTVATLDRADISFADGHRESIQVEQDGNIETPAGRKYVRGMSRAAFEALVRKHFAGVAAIEVVEYRSDEITVLGEVFHQIHTTMGGGPMRVMDGIASANGFTPLANKRRVKLVRQNAGVVTIYELDLREMMRGSDIQQNLLLQAGDVITVPRNFL